MAAVSQRPAASQAESGWGLAVGVMGDGDGGSHQAQHVVGVLGLMNDNTVSVKSW